MRFLAAMLIFQAPAVTHAQVLIGQPHTIDGDSLEMGDTRIRLFGIDAPEARQSCKRGGADWACGEEAAALLRSLIAGKTVSCEGRDTDRYGRLVATCSAGGLDLSRTMVEAGMAVALPQFSDVYVASEARVKARRVGLWGAEFEMPQAYRARHPREAINQPQHHWSATPSDPLCRVLAGS